MTYMSNKERFKLFTKKSKKPEDGYYHIKDLITSYPAAKYYVVFSLRSNGKSYSALEYILERFLSGKGQGAIIRRYDLDFKQRRGGAMFAPLIQNGVVYSMSNGMYNNVLYRAGEFWLRYVNEDGEVIRTSTEPFCYGFALTGNEHDKSTGYPSVTTIVFDEFISRTGYLQDEFVLLMNTISTIVRRRSDVKIIMLGNTINPYNPYFDEMGLTHARDQKQGSIDLYEYGDSKLQVVCEFAEKPQENYGSDVYFAFDNPKLHMITDGEWELNIYPHCPVKFKPKDIKFIFFIIFKEHILQCEVIMFNKYNFIFIHQKTSELKCPDKDLIFDCEHNPLYNYARNIRTSVNGIQSKIQWYFKAEKIFYQDNLTGEIVRNYMEWSNKT